MVVILPPNWCDCSGVLYPLSLRFKYKDVEAAFAAQRKKGLVRNARLLSDIAILLYVFAMVGELATEKHLRRAFPTDAAYLSNQIEFACHGAMVSCIVFFNIVLRCSATTKRCAPSGLELATTSLMAASVTTFGLGSHSAISKILGHNLWEVYGEGWYASDSGLVLSLSIVLAVAHLGLAIRWHVLVLLELTIVLVYVVHVFMIGSSEPVINTSYNIVLLTILVVATAMGKRAAEVCERQVFLTAMKERRKHRDRELTAMQADYATRSSDDDTATSGTLFDQIGHGEGSEDVVMSLKAIADVGEGEHWLIREDEVSVCQDRVLGRGSFGIVVRGVFCGMFVAVKRPKETLQSPEAKILPALCNELRIMRRLRHPHIVTTHGAIINADKRTIALVLEMVGGLVLDRYIKGGTADDPSPYARFQIMLGVARALSYMHTRRPHVVHGDLKDTNIKVEISGEKVHPKLLDFGLSRLVEQRRTRPLGGTLNWVAPEVLLPNRRVRCSADVFSFGRLIAFVATGTTPYEKMGTWEIKKALAKDKQPMPSWPVDCVFKPVCEALVESCLHTDEAQRPRMVELGQKLLGLPRQLHFSPKDGDFLADVLMVETFLEAGPQPAPDDDESPSNRAACFSMSEASRSSGTEQLIYPTKLPTDSDAMMISLLELITRWNIRVSSRPCCEFHASVKVLQKMCRDLAQKQCMPSQLEALGAQCGGCGMLGMDEPTDSCMYCP